MKLQTFCVVLGMLALLTECPAHIGGGQLLLQDLNSKIYCGRNLARALAELCSYQNAEKREVAGPIYNAIIPPYYKEAEHYFWFYWLAPHKAHGLSSPNRGKRFSGIVNECCEKPCSVEEMQTYC